MTELTSAEMNAVFQASVDAVEEAVYNSPLVATTVSGNARPGKRYPWIA